MILLLSIDFIWVLKVCSRSPKISAKELQSEVEILKVNSTVVDRRIAIAYGYTADKMHSLVIVLFNN